MNPKNGQLISGKDRGGWREWGPSNHRLYAHGFYLVTVRHIDRRMIADVRDCVGGMAVLLLDIFQMRVFVNPSLTNFRSEPIATF